MFSHVQQRVLGIVFGRAEEAFLASEVVALASGGTGAVHRELTRLRRAGLVTVRRVGRQRHYQANPESPIFGELRSLVLKTIALVQPLSDALQPFSDSIAAALVFGYVAKGTATGSSDVDLMVIADDMTYSDLLEAIQPAEKVLGKPVNVTIFSRADWRRKRDEESSFVSKVPPQPRFFVLGSEDDIL